MRRYWAFYWPLALTAMVMLVGMQVFNGVLARYPNAEVELATFAYALSLFLLFDIATAFMPQLVTVYSRSRAARQQVGRFCLTIGVLLTLPVVLIAFTPPGHDLLRSLYRVDGAMLAQLRSYLQLLAGIILVHVGQQYLTGLLVMREQTKRVSIVGVTTMLIQVSAAVYGLRAGWAPVTTLTVAYWSSQLFNLGALFVMERHGRAIDEGTAPVPSYAELWRYFWPVAISGMAFGASRPILFAFVSRVPEAVVATAALRVGFDFMFLFQVAVNQFRHFFAAFGTDRLAEKRRFLALVTAGLVSVMAVGVLSPLAELFFGVFLGLRGDLYDYARQVALVTLLVPGVLAVRNYYHGILLAERRTRSMALGSAIRLLALAVAAWLVLELGWLAAASAAGVMVLAFVAEMLVALLAVRRLRGVRG
jgi:hypothetical protein